MAKDYSQMSTAELHARYAIKAEAQRPRHHSTSRGGDFSLVRSLLTTVGLFAAIDFAFKLFDRSHTIIPKTGRQWAWYGGAMGIVTGLHLMYHGKWKGQQQELDGLREELQRRGEVPGGHDAVLDTHSMNVLGPRNNGGAHVQRLQEQQLDEAQEMGR